MSAYFAVELLPHRLGIIVPLSYLLQHRFVLQRFHLEMFLLRNHRLHQVVVELVEIPLVRATSPAVRHHTLGAVGLKAASCDFTFFTLLGDLLVEPLKFLAFEGTLIKCAAIEGNNGVEFVMDPAVTAPIA